MRTTIISFSFFCQCLNLTQLLDQYGLNSESLISPEQFTYLCPALLYQIDRRFCILHYHHVETDTLEEASSSGSFNDSSLLNS